jgi:hypothetical protein
MYYINLKDSINLVVKLPALKFSSRMSYIWKGMVVFTPSITYSLWARSAAFISGFARALALTPIFCII